MNLSNASVIGFFSLPSASLAEHNPSAYNSAMAGAPKGAGTCANCGMGIKHHVVIKLQDGSTKFIGTDCAQKIGGDVGYCVRHRITDEKKKELDQEHAIRADEWAKEQAERQARIGRRAEAFADVLACLEEKPYNSVLSDAQWKSMVQAGATFHTSLALQLRSHSLSGSQAYYAAKAFFGRRKKANADAFDKLIDDLVCDSIEFDSILQNQ